MIKVSLPCNQARGHHVPPDLPDALSRTMIMAVELLPTRVTHETMSDKPSWRDSLQGSPFQGVTATTDGWTGDSLSVEVSGDPATRGSVGAWRGSWNRKRTSVGHLLNTGGTWPGVCLWEWTGRGGAVDKEERGEGRRRESTGRGAGWDQWLPVLPLWSWLHFGVGVNLHTGRRSAP